MELLQFADSSTALASLASDAGIVNNFTPLKYIASYADLITGFVVPTNLGYDDSLQPYPYDPEKAKELLAEAGYGDGFEIGFACPTGAYTNFEQVW